MIGQLVMPDVISDLTELTVIKSATK